MARTTFLNPKALSVSLTTIAVAFIGGMAFAAHPAVPQPVTRFKTTSAVAQGTSDPTVDPTVTLDPTTPTTTTASSTSTSSTSSTSGSTATTTDTPQAPQAPASDPAPTVVAVSATVSDWSAVVTHADGSAEQDKYCVYTYSDDTTQQVLYENRISYAGGVRVLPEPLFDCTLVNAPAAN